MAVKGFHSNGGKGRMTLELTEFVDRYLQPSLRKILIRIKNGIPVSEEETQILKEVQAFKAARRKANV